VPLERSGSARARSHGVPSSPKRTARLPFRTGSNRRRPRLGRRKASGPHSMPPGLVPPADLPPPPALALLVLVRNLNRVATRGAETSAQPTPSGTLKRLPVTRAAGCCIASAVRNSLHLEPDSAPATMPLREAKQQARSRANRCFAEIRMRGHRHTAVGRRLRGRPSKQQSLDPDRRSWVAGQRRRPP